VRRVVFLGVLAFILAACGGSGASEDAVKITVGRTGGVASPYAVIIVPGGAVKVRGNPPVKPTPITSEKDAELSRLVRDKLGNFKSLICAKTLANESSLFITALGKSVVVRGNCQPGFTKLWYELTNALGLNE
jgi:hypothetical protein